jgi:hypothetical protein
MEEFFKELEAVNTVLDISKLAIKSLPDSDAEKAKLIGVLELIYTNYQARLIGRKAMEIAIRSEPIKSVRERISIRISNEIENIEALWKEHKK